jgi:hypothetical protein
MTDIIYSPIVKVYNQDFYINLEYVEQINLETSLKEIHIFFSYRILTIPFYNESDLTTIKNYYNNLIKHWKAIKGVL